MIDPSPTEAVANARLALQDCQATLQRLLSSNAGGEAEISVAKRDVVKAQARLAEAIQVRESAGVK